MDWNFDEGKQKSVIKYQEGQGSSSIRKTMGLEMQTGDIHTPFLTLFSVHLLIKLTL